MNTDRAYDVDEYLADLFVGDDAVLRRALQASEAADLPPIAVSAVQGKFLYLLARMLRARRVLEIGTLGGYSAIWLARALPDGGVLHSLEIDAAHAKVARENLAAGGLEKIASVHLAPALETLERFIAEREEPFDLVFIDADKPNNPEYVRRALELTHSGSAIVLDNVVRDGAVTDARSRDAAVVGTRTALELLAKDPRVDATALQTVGAKGYDGFALALVR